MAAGTKKPIALAAVRHRLALRGRHTAAIALTADLAHPVLEGMALRALHQGLAVRTEVPVALPTLRNKGSLLDLLGATVTLPLHGSLCMELVTTRAGHNRRAGGAEVPVAVATIAHELALRNLGRAAIASAGGRPLRLQGMPFGAGPAASLRCVGVLGILHNAGNRHCLCLCGS